MYIYFCVDKNIEKNILIKAVFFTNNSFKIFEDIKI